MTTSVMEWMNLEYIELVNLNVLTYEITHDVSWKTTFNLSSLKYK